MSDEEAWFRVISLLERDGNLTTALAVARQMLSTLGVTPEREAVVRRVQTAFERTEQVCPICDEINPPKATHCSECGAILRQ